jgi:hypothetical protein
MANRLAAVDSMGEGYLIVMPLRFTPAGTGSKNAALDEENSSCGIS